MDQMGHFHAGEKFRRDLAEVTAPMLEKRRRYLSALDYQVWTSDCRFEPALPIFSVIVTIFGGNLDYISQSVGSVLEQSYQNTELVLVMNGVTPEVSEWVSYRLRDRQRSTLLIVTRGQFDPSQPDEKDPIPNLWNAGLFASRGDFVYFLSYDDYLSNNYVERMVALFLQNSNCVSAAPGVQIVDWQGLELLDKTSSVASGNQRDRYVSGIELARGLMNGRGAFLAPGGVLAHRADTVLNSGGFDFANDMTQLFKIAIRGTVGLDPEATLYWRHHEGQANRVQKRLGLIYFRNLMSLQSDYELPRVHTELAGSEFARQFSQYLEVHAEHIASSSLRDSLRDYGVVPGLRAAIRVLRECPPRMALRLLTRHTPDLPAGVLKRHAPGLYKQLRRYLSGRA